MEDYTRDYSGVFKWDTRSLDYSSDESRRRETLIMITSFIDLPSGPSSKLWPLLVVDSRLSYSTEFLGGPKWDPDLGNLPILNPES